MHFKFFIFIVLGFSSFSSALAKDRIALVIGNGDYKKVSSLANPSNDARDIANTLRTLGFEVIEKHNLNRKQMGNAIHQFGQRLGKDTVGLFYYAGHGLQIKGKNYLLPLNAPINSKDEVPYETIDVDRILSKMETAGNGLNIMILDACRNNPFKGRGGFRDLGRGLARVNAPTGSLIIYATALGEKAADGQGKNGLFTKHLLKNMVRPQLDVEIMLRDIRYGVIQEAKRLGYQQVPWSTSSLSTPFCFAGCRQSKQLPVIPTQPKPKIATVSTQPVVQKQRYFKPEMVAIPAGSFQMGCVSGKNCSDDEKPVHTVKINAFCMAKTEVTFSQWDACVKAGGCSHKPRDAGWGRGQRPVINVNWNDTQQFVKWLSDLEGKHYRLPTEAEWEYAVRAGTETKYSWGDSIGLNKANCNGCDSQWSNKETAPVASFPANTWGLYDMHGNVWEWVQDCYHDTYNGAPSNAKSWTTECKHPAVLRGGSWVNFPNALPAANRLYYNRVYRSTTYGFRVVRTN